MLSLERNGYPASLVRDALHMVSGMANLGFRYELLDSQNVKIRDIDTMLSASVSHGAFRPIKRMARFQLVDDGTIDFLSNRIKPYVQIWIPPGRIQRNHHFLSPRQMVETVSQGSPQKDGYAEFPLGVFLLSTAPRKLDESGTITRDVEAYDQSQILVDDKVADRYTVTAGTPYIDAVRNLLTSAGVTLTNLTPSDKVLPITLDWKPGTTKASIINDLLSAINYRGLWFNSDGYAVAAPYTPPSHLASEYTYRDDERSVLLPEAEQSLDLFSVPNQFVVYTSDAERPSMRSVYTNANPGSPLSTVSRGRTIVADPVEVDAADQETLDGIAARMAFEASQVYEHVRFQTSIMPLHDHADVLTLDYRRLGVSAKFQEVGWAMDLHAGAVMQHEVRRIVTV